MSSILEFLIAVLAFIFGDRGQGKTENKQPVTTASSAQYDLSSLVVLLVIGFIIAGLIYVVFER